MEQEYWPGTDIPKSRNNAFTIGYSRQPHGYVPGTPQSDTVVRPVHRTPGGFARNNGTIPGMGRPAHNPRAFTINKKTRLAA